MALLIAKITEQSDLLKKVLAENNKININEMKMANQDAKDSISHIREKDKMKMEKDHQQELIDKQKEADLTVLKATPKPKAKLAKVNFPLTVKNKANRIKKVGIISN